MKDDKIRIQSVIIKRLMLTFFVLFSLLNSENGFAQKKWTRDYVRVNWDALHNYVVISIQVYDYIYGMDYEHGYLKDSKIDFSFNGVEYFRMMEISTQRQKKTFTTSTCLKNKQCNVKTRILNSVLPYPGTIWRDNTNLLIEVPNIKYLAWVKLAFDMGKPTNNNWYIRISGCWFVDGVKPVEYIPDVVYPIKLSALISNTPGINTQVSINDTVRLVNESEAIVIKGATFGSNIKVYTTSGVEIISVISNNDVVKIKVPAKQIYIVHIGKTRYKVAM